MVNLRSIAGEEKVMALVYIKECHFSKVGSLHYYIRKPLVLVVQTSNIQINTKPSVIGIQTSIKWHGRWTCSFQCFLTPVLRAHLPLC